MFIFIQIAEGDFLSIILYVLKGNGRLTSKQLNEYHCFMPFVIYNPNIQKSVPFFLL